MATKKGTKFTKAHRLALSKAAKARYAKVRGVKPGTKRGKYHKGIGKPVAFEIDLIKKQHIINEKHSMEFPFNKIYSPAPVLTLCGQLEDAILLLENRLSNAIAKINSLM